MEYNIRLEYDLPATEEHGDKLVTALERFHPGAGVSDTGNIEVSITLQAENARQAAELGLALSGSASQANLAAFEVITSVEFDRRQLVTPLPELIGSDEAAALLGISRQAIGKRFATGDLPGQRVGERSIVFARADVEAAAKRRPTSAVDYILERMPDHQ